MHFACRHIKSDGVRCQAPAMRAGNFCYYHTKNRSTARIGVMDDFVIPIPEDHASIRNSIAQTLNALISKRIDAKTAGLVLYGLQLALQAIPKDICLPPDSVRDMTQSSEGDELAPAECVYPASDCSACSRADSCQHCEIDPEEEEEEEEEDTMTDSTNQEPRPANNRKRQRSSALGELRQASARTVRGSSNQIAQNLLARTLAGHVNSAQLLLALIEEIPPQTRKPAPPRSLAKQWSDEPLWEGPEFDPESPTSQPFEEAPPPPHTLEMK